MIGYYLQKILKCIIQLPLLCGIAVICIIQVSFAGNSNIKQEAELFAKSALVSAQELHANAKPTDVPTYETDNPEEVKYYSDSSSMESNAISRKNNEDSETSSIIEDSYNKKQEFFDDGNKLMSKSRYIEDNPENVINQIQEEYPECEEGSGGGGNNNPNYTTKRCDEYQNIQGSCYLGNLIHLNSDTDYICNKEKEFYKKTVTSNLDVSCSSKQTQFFPTTFQNFQGFSVSGDNLYLGLNRGGTLGGNCGGYVLSWRFNIDNLNDVKRLFWHTLVLDDTIRVHINGVKVWEWGWECEHGAIRTFHPNLDFKPYLKQGSNEIIFHVIVGGKGMFYSHLTWEYSKCNGFNFNWNDDIKREGISSMFDESKTEVCSKTKPEECLLSGTYTTADGYQRDDGCRSKKQEYSCTQNNFTDYCKTISKVESCSKFESKCIETDSITGTCNKTQERYTCGDLTYYNEKENSVILDSPYSVLFTGGSGSNYNYNNITGSNKLCNEATDNISHCDIISHKTGQKSCYLGSSISDCSIYEEDSRCNHQNTLCFDDNCLHKEKEYSCKVDEGNNQNNNQTLMCSNQKYCLSEECAQDTSYEKGNSLPKVLTYLKTLEEMNKDNNKEDVNNMQIFTGKGSKCEKDIFGARNCCKDSGWGDSIGIGNCSYEEENLALQKEKGHCIYIGSYCSQEEKLTGTCIKKAQSYCCFNSKLSKIIQQQGRNQIGLDLGNPESPNCRGLSVEEMQSLNFDKIDFTEYTQELTLDMQNISRDNIEDKVINEISTSNNNN